MKRSRQEGFTLIEIMIVVAIVATLLVVVLPSYQNQVEKTRRTDAMQALMDVASRQESFMLDRSTYTEDMNALGLGADPYISPEGYYSIDATFGDTGSIATSYELTATAIDGEAQDGDERCTTFTLDSEGNRGATGTLADECW